MKKFWLQVFALLILSSVGLYFFSNPRTLDNIPFLGLTGTSVFGNKPPVDTRSTIAILAPTGLMKTQLKVDIANTPEERSLGLGGRDSLATDSGMLFVFDKVGKYQFWMKGMKIPLDFIWIQGDEVVDLLPNVPVPAPNTPDPNLPVYGPNTTIDKVLEVNAGFIQQQNIAIGDKLKMVQ